MKAKQLKKLKIIYKMKITELEKLTTCEYVRNKITKEL